MSIRLPAVPAQVADPLGGSFYVEALTAAMEEQAEGVIQEVEHLGGMTEAIISGGRMARRWKEGAFCGHGRSERVAGVLLAWRSRRASAIGEEIPVEHLGGLRKPRSAVGRTCEREMVGWV